MKIVICATHSWPIPTPVHTGDVVILDLAIALTELGHDVSLVAPAGTKFPKLLEVPCSMGTGEPSAHDADQFALGRWARELGQSDVIHDFSVTKSVARFAQAKGHPAIVTPLGGSEWTQLSTMRNVVCHSAEMRERGLRGATDYEGTEWPLLAGPPQTPIRDARVVHLGVDTDWYCPRSATGWPELTEEQVVALYVEEDATKQVEIGRALGLCDEARRWICEDHSETDAHNSYEHKRRKQAVPQQKEDFFLWLGRWSPQRGYKLAIELAKRTGIELVMSGERPADCRFEPERSCALEAVALSRGVPNIRFEWLPVEGHHEAKRELYRRARAFLMFPRFREPFGLQQVEALACGTPVIATRMGSIPEVIKSGLTGFIWEPGDLIQFESLGESLKCIYPADCRADAATRFSRRAMAERYVELYAAVCAGETW